MKKYIAALAIVASTAAVAGPHHHGWHHHRHHYHGGWGWVAPAVISGAVVYGLTRPAETVIVQQPQVVVTPQTGCTPWREVQQLDGTIIRERTCYGVQ